jgi:hypothetical protein
MEHRGEGDGMTRLASGRRYLFGPAEHGGRAYCVTPPHVTRERLAQSNLTLLPRGGRLRFPGAVIRAGE